MRYEDMTIEAVDATLERTPDKQRIGHFTVHLLGSPAGDPSLAVPLQYDDKQLQLKLQQLETRALDRAGLVALGRDLASWLLPPKQEGAEAGVRELFTTSLALVGPDTGLRLRLRLPPQLAALPWEYLYVDPPGGGEGMDGFLALDPRVSIVRHEPLAAPGSLPLTTGPIKVVAALASAEGLPQLDLSKEKADLQAAFAGQQGIDPVIVEDASLTDIQQVIAEAKVFHFAGHGVFNRQMGDLPGTYTGVGALALYDGPPVEADQLMINLRGDGIRLAVLGGCETGRRDGVNVWSGIAPALIKQQIPAVVANQFPIKDACAIAFSKLFYSSLVGGLAVDRAVAAGRIAAYNADKEGRDWGVPVLYMRDADGLLFGGAADAGVREQAAAAAKAVVDLHVDDIAAGGKVLGAKVGQITGGHTLDVTVTADDVAGELTGATIDKMTGGNAEIKATVDDVAAGGSVTGATIDL